MPSETKNPLFLTRDDHPENGYLMLLLQPCCTIVSVNMTFVGIKNRTEYSDTTGAEVSKTDLNCVTA
jgi:hypothetical protein